LIARTFCAVALLLAAAACSVPSPTSLFGGGSHYRVYGPVDDMLDRRSRALMAGDEAKFLADLDQKQPELLQHERMVFANLHQFQFSDFRYHQFFPPDIAKPIDLKEGKDVEVGVLLTYRLAGIDAGITQDGYDYTIVGKSGRPVVTKIDINGLGAARNNVPWELVPLHVAHSGNVTVAVDDSGGDPTRLAAAFDAADQQVRRLWGSRTSAPGTLVFASADQKQTRNWFPAGLSATIESAALVVPVPATDQRGIISGDTVGGRVVLTLGRIPADQVAGTYRHELTHAISAPLVHREPAPPLWAIEGYAAWMEDANSKARLDVVRRAVQQGTFTGQLPDNQTFYDQRVSLNYGLGLTVFRFVAGRWGPDRASDLYADTVSGVPLATATTRVLSIDQAAFLQQWAAYVRQLPA
jgi:hypothetical protein